MQHTSSQVANHSEDKRRAKSAVKRQGPVHQNPLCSCHGWSPSADNVRQQPVSSEVWMYDAINPSCPLRLPLCLSHGQHMLWPMAAVSDQLTNLSPSLPAWAFNQTWVHFRFNLLTFSLAVLGQTNRNKNPFK